MLGSRYVRSEQDLDLNDDAKEHYAIEILADLLQRALALSNVVEVYESAGKAECERAALLDPVVLQVRCFLEDAREALNRSRRGGLVAWDHLDCGTVEPGAEENEKSLLPFGGILPCHGDWSPAMKEGA